MLVACRAEGAAGQSRDGHGARLGLRDGKSAAIGRRASLSGTEKHPTEDSRAPAISGFPSGIFPCTLGNVSIPVQAMRQFNRSRQPLIL
jgi:hypothetical protein